MITPKVDFTRFDEEIEELIKRDEPQRAVVFYGSSTFTFWGHDKLKKAMAPVAVVNRGFGGSTAHDAMYQYKKLILPLASKMIVWYEGDNDPECGYTTDEIMSLTTELFDRMRLDFQGINFVVLSVKKSPSRRHLWDKMDEYNSAIKKYCDEKEDMQYVEFNDIALDKNKSPRDELYIEDMLHFNDRGYEQLAELLRPYINL